MNIDDDDDDWDCNAEKGLKEEKKDFGVRDLTLPTIHLGPAGQRLTWTKWVHSESTY